MSDPDYMNSWGLTAMRTAIQFERFEVVRELLRLGASPNRRTWHHAAPGPVVHAAECGDIAIATLLCEAGGNVDVVGENGERFLDLVEEAVLLARGEGRPEPDVEAFRRLYEKYSRRNMVRKHLG
ncbi:MAG: ankyrin repeat domain-containing protein [Sandaracinus sp.]|nr:ankyrin repeat domain-containing protein [Sandaracinus sp.]